MYRNVCSIICFILLACKSQTSPEVSTEPSSTDSIAETRTTVDSNRESESMAWLRHQKVLLDSQYFKTEGFEKKLEFLKAFESKMNEYINSKNRILDSVSVDVEKVDSLMPSILNIHLSNPLLEYFQSIGTDDSSNRIKINEILKELKTGSHALVHFQVESIKVNDPTSPLAPFEIIGSLLKRDSIPVKK
jgi:hypothetical protein